MYEKFFYADKVQCAELGEKLFIEQSGVGKEGTKFERMRKNAFKIRNSVEERINTRALYKYYDRFELKGDTLRAGGTAFKCTAFEQIDREAVEGVLFYAACAGDFELENVSVIDMLYADIWGNAFTDAVRFLLKEELEKFHMLSDSFGPGFYGMDVSYMKEMAQIIDFGELGMRLHKDRILLPLKSCAGMYLAVNDKYRKLHSECQFCRGSRISCNLCQFYKGA